MRPKRHQNSTITACQWSKLVSIKLKLINWKK